MKHALPLRKSEEVQVLPWAVSMRCARLCMELAQPNSSYPIGHQSAPAFTAASGRYDRRCATAPMRHKEVRLDCSTSRLYRLAACGSPVTQTHPSIGKPAARGPSGCAAAQDEPSVREAALPTFGTPTPPSCRRSTQASMWRAGSGPRPQAYSSAQTARVPLPQRSRQRPFPQIRRYVVFSCAFVSWRIPSASS